MDYHIINTMTVIIVMMTGQCNRDNVILQVLQNSPGIILLDIVWAFSDIYIQNIDHKEKILIIARDYEHEYGRPAESLFEKW